MTEVDDQLKLLEDSALKLNQASDSINTLIENVERRLTAANPGMECWVNCSSYGVGNFSIGFAKVGTTWHLVIEDISRGAIGPLSDASRSVRIAALEALPGLLSDLHRKVQVAFETIERAKASYGK